MYKRCTSSRAFLSFFLSVGFLGLSFLSAPLVRGDDAEKRDPRFVAVDNIFEQAVSEGKIPGAVVLVGHKGEVVYRRAFGSRSLDPRREPITLTPLFHLPSLPTAIS